MCSGYPVGQQLAGVPERSVQRGQGQTGRAAQVDLDLVLRLSVSPENRQHDEFGCCELCFEYVGDRLQRHLPLVLSGVSRVVESVRVTEMFNYATYPDRAAVYEILGFGKPPEFSAFAAAPGVFTFGWGPVLHQLATGLGVKIDRIEENVERVPAAEPFDTPTGHIAAGTIAAMRSTLTGYVGDKVTFVLDHVTRMRDDIAADWPQPHICIEPKDLGYGLASGRGLYRVEIEGC
jgi:hypothetical protein